jgi:hypothetical protein
MADYIDATAVLFNQLLRKAAPGISGVQAFANGAVYRARLRCSGMTAAEFANWRKAYSGKSLVVHLNADGEPHVCHLLAHQDAEAYVAAHAGSVVVASWGANR